MGNLTRYDIILKADDDYQESQSYAFPGNPGPDGFHTVELQRVTKEFQTSRDLALNATAAEIARWEAYAKATYGL